MKLVDIVGRRTAADLWAPVWGSDAEAELAQTACLPRAGSATQTWGRDPDATVYPTMAILTDSLLAYARTVARTLACGDRHLTLVLDTLTRAILESASQVWWLAEPGIGGRDRVARLAVVRRMSAMAYEKTIQKMGAAPTGGYGSTVADIDNYYEHTLGLAREVGRKGGWTGYEKQLAMGYGDRAASFMRDLGHAPDEATYAFYSGAPHAEVWRLIHGYSTTTGTGATASWVPVDHPDHARAALSVCIDALVYPAARAMTLLGRGAAVAEIASLRSQLRQAMKIA